MIRAGAHYYINPFWNSEISERQAKSNIFCYGKHRSGKTKNIGIFTALCALEENRACVIYAQNASEEYTVLKTVAEDFDIPVIEMDVTDFEPNTRSHNRSIRKIKEYMTAWKTAYEENRHDAPFLMLLSDRNIQTKPALVIHDILNYSLFPFDGKKEKTLREMTASRNNALLIVMDDMMAPFYIAPAYLGTKMFQFCLIMATADIAGKSWRMNALEIVAWEYNIIPPIVRDKNSFRKYLAENEQRMFSYFFSNIDIVVCTGNTVKPDDHRDFVKRIIHCGIIKNVKASHRYICEEVDSATHTNSMLLHSKTSFGHLSINNIAESNYWEIANNDIIAGKLILLVDDKVAVESNVPKEKKDAYVLEPVVFSDKRSAQNYLELEWYWDNSISMTSEEAAPSVHIYRGTKNEDGKMVPIEYTILQLGPDDVDNYRIRFLYRILQILEKADDQTLPSDKIDTKEFDELIPVAEHFPALTEISAIEPYWEQYQKNGKPDESVVATEELTELPDRALFLGGHWNMVKKLEALHPDWDFITDDEIKGGWRNMTYKYIFFWTKHCSHKLQNNILSKLASGAETIYVTATNVERLEDEILTGYRNSLARKKRGA